MRELQFEVQRQAIKKNGDFENLVRGSSGYLRAAFTFSPEWNGCRKAASFWVNGEEYARPIVSGGCMIPDEACAQQRFEVSVTGKREGYRITTNKVRVYQGGD